MTDKLKQIIAREMKSLPKETQGAVGSVDWADIAEKISQKYLFDEDENNILQAIILTVLVGLSDLETMARDIENEIGTSKEEAGTITMEADKKIFTPIYNSLTETIKREVQNKPSNWRQSVDFILSGGNYFVFMDGGSGWGTMIHKKWSFRSSP